MTSNHANLYTRLAIQHLRAAVKKRLPADGGSERNPISISLSTSPHSLSRTDLAEHYAQEILEKVFKLSGISRRSVKLYAAQLLHAQSPAKGITSVGSKKRALVISPDPLEQNLFVRFLRAFHFIPVVARDKKTLLKYLKYSFELVFISDLFTAVDLHAITQIANATAPKPFVVMVAAKAYPEYKALGCDGFLQHPFSREAFAQVIKNFQPKEIL